MNDKIDFVITWVDGNDIKWQTQRNSCLGLKGDCSVNRFRDWQLLKYWFRGVEKYAPWVNRVHFVTWGHLPEWLDVNNPKLNIVKHEDFIEEKYLPTFNSNAIELNIHKIKDLAEQFVYFNDDMFLIDHVKKEDFFRNGYPCDTAVLGAVLPIDEAVNNIIYNNMVIINRHFDKTDLSIKQWRKLLNWRYGKLLLRTMCLYPFSKHTGFYDLHVSIPFRKSTFEEVWSVAHKELTTTCLNQARTSQDYSIWLMRYWQLASGKFVPRKPIGWYFEIGDPDIKNYIVKQKNKVVCCNDVRTDIEYNIYQKSINDIFDKLLPKKSRFEK